MNAIGDFILGATGMFLLQGSALAVACVATNSFQENTKKHAQFCDSFTFFERCVIIPINEEFVFSVPFTASSLPKENRCAIQAICVACEAIQYGSISIITTLSCLNTAFSPFSFYPVCNTFLRFLSGIHFSLLHAMENSYREKLRALLFHAPFYFCNWAISNYLVKKYKENSYASLYPIFSHMVNNALCLLF